MQRYRSQWPRAYVKAALSFHIRPLALSSDCDYNTIVTSSQYTPAAGLLSGLAVKALPEDAYGRFGNSDRSFDRVIVRPPGGSWSRGHPPGPRGVEHGAPYGD